MLATLIQLSRYFPWPRKCHAGGGSCTDIGEVAALTYPFAQALAKCWSLVGDCQNEHPFR